MGCFYKSEQKYLYEIDCQIVWCGFYKQNNILFYRIFFQRLKTNIKPYKIAEHPQAFCVVQANYFEINEQHEFSRIKHQYTRRKTIKYV